MILFVATFIRNALVAKVHWCMLHRSRFLLCFAHEKIYPVARADGFDAASPGNACGTGAAACDPAQ